jgi:hypothetical protein
VLRADGRSPTEPRYRHRKVPEPRPECAMLAGSKENGHFAERVFGKDMLIAVCGTGFVMHDFDTFRDAHFVGEDQGLAGVG